MALTQHNYATHEPSLLDNTELRHLYNLRFITVSGPSGSGKTTISNYIAKFLISQGISTVVISLDSFYKPKSANVSNYDDKSAFDWDAFRTFVNDAANQSTRNVQIREMGAKSENMNTLPAPMIPQYNFTIHDRDGFVPAWTATPEIVIIEGIYAYEMRYIRYEYSIQIKSSLDYCYDRRLTRDVIERGRTIDDIRQQWFGQVRPTIIKRMCENDNPDCVIANDYLQLDELFNSAGMANTLKQIVKHIKQWQKILYY